MSFHINYVKEDHVINSLADLKKCRKIQQDLRKQGYVLTYDDYEMNGDHIQVFSKGDDSVSFNELAR